MNRRDFLAASATTLATLSPGWTKDKTMIPVIDTHQHLWDPTKLQMNWLTDDSPLKATFMPAEYKKATEGINIAKAIYMEVDVKEDFQQLEADTLIELIKSKSSPTVAAVVSGRPAKPTFKKYVDQFKGSPYIKGIRQVLHVEDTPAGYVSKPEFVEGIRYLGSIGLSFDLCVRAVDLPEMKRLVQACPDTRFILDHCGNPLLSNKDHSAWKKELASISECKNLVCKISGFIASGKKGEWKVDDLAPIIRHVINSFGWNRVMFGGDWPVCTLAASYKEWFGALSEVISSDSSENQKKLLYDNASAFYGV
jgi:L-fuconolactonase